MGITQEEFGLTKGGRQVHRFTLRNANGVTVKVITYGAAVTAIEVPDKAGSVKDVVLGHDTVAGYEDGRFYFGIVVGRCCNRIAEGRFVIDGQEFQLDTNNGPNHLHGGFKGFGMRVWDAIVEGNCLRLTHKSADGEERYPGEVTAEVTYELTDNNALRVVLTAVTTRPTPINLTNHSYFNLAGHDASAIYQHRVSIDADHYIPVDENLIPTGQLAPVKDTVYDFRQPVELIERIHDVAGGGFDNSFGLNSPGRDKLSIKVSHPESGRSLEVSTSQPGVHFYSANFVDGSARGKEGVYYQKHCGLCLETCNFPDAVNQPNFPNAILRPGEKYERTTVFKFSW